MKILKWVILHCVTGLIAALIGILIILLTAKYTVEPSVFLIFGAAAYILIFIGGTKLFSKRIKNNNLRVYRITSCTVGCLLMVFLALGLLMPLSSEQKEPAVEINQRYWNLQSGSKIAYVHLSSGSKSSLPPIIFLHGGPGVPDMAGDASYFGQLTHEGYDVYVYDEIGTGFSSRLKNPLDYTIQRNVSDLELIRQKIGAEKIILLGHSYGGEITANYITAYGNHVEKAVFISPGSINPRDTSSGNLISRLTSEEKSALFKEILNPRAMMTYGLLQINPSAARNFAGDNEMDARFDIVYKYSQPALHSRSKPIGPKLSRLGFYANQTPQSAAAKPMQDIRNTLSKRNISSLIVKASGDYLSWSSALDYKKALHNSTLVYFTDAGHNVYQDQPELFMKVLKAFLADSPLPVADYKESEAPADYEGVH
jgi:proline iminopeptidase